MKRNLAILLLLSASMLLVTNEAHGDTVGEATTAGEIEFSANTAPVPPVDPDDPEQPIQPIQPPSAGPLSMSYVTDLYFGDQTVSSGAQTYYADTAVVTRTDGTTSEVANFVQLSDLSGSGNGWNLYCQFDQPLTNEANDQIKGAELRFTNMTFTSNDGVNQTIPRITQEVVVKSAASSPTLIASVKKGHGSWTVSFGKDVSEGKKSVGLYIPEDGVTEAGSYTTSLTWTMSNEK